MSDRLPWFRCNPSALLGAMAGLLPDESLIYFTVLLRIYETGGPIADCSRTLARRTGMTQRKAALAIESLAMAGKITILSDDRIDSGTTHAELEWQRDSRGDKSRAGRESAKARSRRAHIDRIAEGDKRVVRFPDQKTLKNQRSDPTAVERTFNEEEPEEEEQRTPSHAGKLPIDPRWLPDAEDVAAAIAIGVPEAEVSNQAAIFVDKMLEWRVASGNWRASWRNWARRYRPDMASGSRPQDGPNRRREPRMSAAAQRLTELHDQLTEAAATGALHVPSDAIDADELLLLAGPEHDEAGGGALDGGAGGARGEDRGVAWAAGGGSRPSDALLRAVGQGGHDTRASSALRRRKAPDTAA